MSGGVRFPVLLHGFAGSSASWGARLVDDLTGAGLTPVLVDLPGHGAEAGEVDPSRFTLEAAVDSVAGAGRWPEDVVGYSMGGRIALHFAVRYPGRVRRLVLESASPGLASEGERAARRAADEELAGRIVAEGVDWFVDYWESLPLFASRARLDPALLASHRTSRRLNDPRSLAAALTGLSPGRLPSLWDELPRVDTPTLLLVGELDVRYVDIAERMCRAMPDARLVVVPGVGHTVHLEAPAAWRDAVVPFLSS
ncbi:MAG: 2-succinyl-6-hydroxy-2,4-cyclohexadiene-1-carboxylate synthase [Gemmatimonadetes bacterium]|nr:2-succinyl-6-hydroxy-2,4-cyclohexadiene-1-carboxylate synthase [Gemmatimonadota bacterium]